MIDGKDSNWWVVGVWEDGSFSPDIDTLMSTREDAILMYGDTIDRVAEDPYWEEEKLRYEKKGEKLTVEKVRIVLGWE